MANEHGVQIKDVPFTHGDDAFRIVVFLEPGGNHRCIVLQTVAEDRDRVVDTFGADLVQTGATVDGLIELAQARVRGRYLNR